MDIGHRHRRRRCVENEPRRGDEYTQRSAPGPFLISVRLLKTAGGTGKRARLIEVEDA
jgi:hypothetical protein